MTINFTRGCAHRCLYCYAQGYRNAPQDGVIYLYHNLIPKLKGELKGKRFTYVHLSTASDPFQPLPQIQDAAFNVLHLLLERGIPVSFLTKGFIPPRFFDLFAQYRGLIYAQIGLVSLNPFYHITFEPGAAKPQHRLDNIANLRELGIPVEVRIDPLLPLITSEEVAHLFLALSSLGVRRAIVSFLFLRPAIERRLREKLPHPLFSHILKTFHGSIKQRVAASDCTFLPHPYWRMKTYNWIREMAQRHNITTVLCACKNPDIGGDSCLQGVDNFFSFTPHAQKWLQHR